MKKLLLPILFIAFSMNAQQKETVDLKWKISDTLTYKTVMKDIILEKGKDQDVNDSISDEMSGLLKAMQNQLSDLKYETKLFPDKNGNIDIAMMFKKAKTDTTETLFSNMAKLNGNVVLRGKLSQTGELLSFYYKRAQNNLISILFELPIKPVKIGDEWTLKADMISMDQNFKADTLYKKNTVRLKDLTVLNGNKVAIIEYNLKQYVSGDFGNRIMPMFSKIFDKKIFMEMTHIAIGKFNIDQGRWLEYDGIMEINTNFQLMGMGGNKRTEFKLTPKK